MGELTTSCGGYARPKKLRASLVARSMTESERCLVRCRLRRRTSLDSNTDKTVRYFWVDWQHGLGNRRFTLRSLHVTLAWLLLPGYFK